MCRKCLHTHTRANCTDLNCHKGFNNGIFRFHTTGMCAWGVIALAHVHWVCNLGCFCMNKSKLDRVMKIFFLALVIDFVGIRLTAQVVLFYTAF